MSSTTNPISNPSSSHSLSTNAQTLPVPTFLETAGKTTKIIFGIAFAVVGVGSLGIGITMAPFTPEIGGGAIALGSALLALAGYLIFSSAISSASNLNSRNITDFTNV